MVLYTWWKLFSFVVSFDFCHSFCMPILASRLLGASLAFSGYRGAPIAEWVSPWSKAFASTDIKKKRFRWIYMVTGQCGPLALEHRHS